MQRFIKNLLSQDQASSWGFALIEGTCCLLPFSFNKSGSAAWVSRSQWKHFKAVSSSATSVGVGVTNYCSKNLFKRGFGQIKAMQSLFILKQQQKKTWLHFILVQSTVRRYNSANITWWTHIPWCYHCWVVWLVKSRDHRSKRNNQSSKTINQSN